MSHYLQLAVLFVRLGAAYAISIGVLTLTLTAMAYVVGGDAALGPGPGERLGVSACYLIGGLILAGSSRPMGRLLARGLT